MSLPPIASGEDGQSIQQATMNLTVIAEEDIFCDREGKIKRVAATESVLFKINANTKLKKLKKTYASRIGVPHEGLRFTFAGRVVHDHQCATDLFMVTGDVIQCGQNPTYLLTSNSIPSTMVSDFEKLLDSPELCDVQLVVGKDKVALPAVKAILCARSEKFRGMFSKNFSEGHQATVHLKTATPTAMRVMLRYLYTDKLEIPQDSDEAVRLLMLAEEYMLPYLKREAESQLLGKINEKNVCKILQTADLHDAKALKEACKQFLLERIDSEGDLGEELQSTPGLLLELARDAVAANKRRRLV